MKTSTTNFSCSLCIAFMAFFAFGCGSDDSGINDCTNNAWAQIFTDEATAYGNALTAYQNNPTPENCGNIKSAAIEYLEALRDALDCVPTANRAEVDQAINEAQAEVNQEDCD